MRSDEVEWAMDVFAVRVELSDPLGERFVGVGRVAPLVVAALVLASIVGACGGGDSKRAGGTASPRSSATVAADGTAVRTAGADATSTAAATPMIDPAAEADAASVLCANAVETPPGTVASPDVVELSGLASGRANDGVYWAHNDSGDTARVFALDAEGTALATYTLAGADAIDWEDMASAPNTARGAELYMGDIGDNRRARPDIVVYRVREPAVNRAAPPITATLSDVEKLTLRYPDGAHDAETLMVDARSADLIVVTKDAGGSQVFRAPGRLAANASVTLELAGRIDFSQLKRRTEFPADAPPLARVGGALATGGDISPVGDVIAIRTYSAVWLWSRAAGQSVGDALAAAPCEAASAAEPQGEAIAFDADGLGYVTSSEGEHPMLHHFRPG